MKDTQCTKI